MHTDDNKENNAKEIIKEKWDIQKRENEEQMQKKSMKEKGKNTKGR